MEISISEATNLYEVGCSVEVNRILVDNSNLRKFSIGLNKLLSQIDKDDPAWNKAIAILRNVRWKLATVPLPFNHDMLNLAEAIAVVEDCVSKYRQIYFNQTDSLENILADLTNLVNSDVNPLGDAIHSALTRITTPSASRSLILRDGHYAAAVENYFNLRSTNTKVLTVAQLDVPDIYDEMVLIGATLWFPSYIFTSPRMRHMSVIQLAWLHDEVPTSSIFPASKKDNVFVETISESSSRVANQNDFVEAIDLFPVMDWNLIPHSVYTVKHFGGTQEVAVEAHCFTLASGQITYLEAEIGSRIFVVEFNPTKIAHLVPIESIQQGTYLVLRIGGEGDYIFSIADSILGKQAKDLRGEQLRWKELLCDLIDVKGIGLVSQSLRASGSARANHSNNVKRWASSNSIKTQDRKDFDAIMSVIGLASEANTLWQKMEIIHKAHQQAGQKLRKLLEREVLNADIRELERNGYIDCELPEVDGGGLLRVARVMERSPNTYMVSKRTTRKLIDSEELVLTI